MGNQNYKLASSVCPTERQIKWQDTEFYGMISYGMPTFTGQDFGDGFTVAEQFYPIELDTDIWAEHIKKCGMNGLIMTAKHYDGFCNWLTETTDYCVSGSKFLDGKGDVVKMAEISARKFGLKFGVSYTICDNHERNKTKSEKEYNEYIQAQIEELTTGYGELFEIYLDDRCDMSFNFDIDFGSIYKIIRKNQPNCAICFRGPDGRYNGNGLGVTRKNEWSSIPAMYGYNEDGTTNPATEKVKSGHMMMDLGSRKAIKHTDKFIWYPCEVYYPCRKHKFYKKDDDYSSKTKDKILKVYQESVGNNSNLLFDLAPDKYGRFTDSEMQIFAATGKDLHVLFGYNLLKDCTVSGSSSAGDLFKCENITEDSSSFWKPSENDEKPTLEITFDKPEMFDKIILKENIAHGQQVEEFSIYIPDEKGKWKKHFEGETIGRKRICQIKAVESQKIQIVFEKFRDIPEISYCLAN